MAIRWVCSSCDVTGREGPVRIVFRKASANLALSCVWKARLSVTGVRMGQIRARVGIECIPHLMIAALRDGIPEGTHGSEGGRSTRGAAQRWTQRYWAPSA